MISIHFYSAELADVQAEQQREMEGLLDNVRQLTRDLRLQMLVIDAFIPPEYQVGILMINTYQPMLYKDFEHHIERLIKIQTI